MMREVVAFAKKGGIVIGICNGFQILTEAGLLPGVLMRNAGLKFICDTVSLKVENTQTLFTKAFCRGGVTPPLPIRMPIAHGEGNYFADEGRNINAFVRDGRATLYSHPGRVVG